jgi:hypothetical protein
MATIDLGKIKLVNRGAYNNSTAYTVDDLVQSGGTTYICIQNSTGNAVTDTSYWNVLAQKGSDGTDVGATLTTQGDILYRDGSGLQRLAKGTSGQVLKQGTNHPEWGTDAGGGLIKLADSTLSSSANAIILDNVFSSTYQAYKINFINYRTNADNGQPRLLWRSGTSGSNADRSENWSTAYNYTYGNFNSASPSHGGGFKKYTTEGGYIGNTWNFPDEGNFFSYDVFLSDGQKPTMHGISTGKQVATDTGTHWVMYCSMMSYDDVNHSSNTHTGIKLYAMNSRDIQSGCKIVIYGYLQ